METEPPQPDDSTPPESSADEPVPAVPTRETTPVWAQTSPAAPARKKGDPDWSHTETSTNGDGGKGTPPWAATVPTAPGDADEEPAPAASASTGDPAPQAPVAEVSVSEPAVSKPDVSEPPAEAPLTEPPKAVAADALKSTWPPAASSGPAPPEETDIWPPEPPTERAMPAWPPGSEVHSADSEPATPAQAIPSWPDSFDAVASTSPATATPAAPADPVAPESSASTPPTITPESKPVPPAAPVPAPARPAATVQPNVPPAAPPAPIAPNAPAAPTAAPAPPAPAPQPPPTMPVAPPSSPEPPAAGPSAPAARPAWAPTPASAPPAPPAVPHSSTAAMQVPAWAPRVPLAAEPGTPTWFSPKESIPHATAQPIPAGPQPSPEPTPAPPIVGGQLPVAQVPAPAPPAAPKPAEGKPTWQVVEQRHAANMGQISSAPTAEDRSYAEWFAWAKRGGAPASACHAAAQGAFKALSSGKDVATAVQWATAAMSRPAEPVSHTRQQYCAWFALANIDLNLDQHRAHLFANGAIQALDAGQDASAAHAAGLAAAGIR